MNGPTCISCKRPSLTTWRGYCLICYPPKRAHHDPEQCRHAQCNEPATVYDGQLCDDHAKALLKFAICARCNAGFQRYSGMQKYCSATCRETTENVAPAGTLPVAPLWKTVLEPGERIDNTEIAFRLGCNSRTIIRARKRGHVSMTVGDDMACALGLHPADIWPQKWWQGTCLEAA